ncbi:hypothetical protein A2U01_0097241, partial [Trifolium medium]|nr:hypothetical protein [Trifolium medium]
MPRSIRKIEFNLCIFNSFQAIERFMLNDHGKRSIDIGKRLQNQDLGTNNSIMIIET